MILDLTCLELLVILQVFDNWVIYGTMPYQCRITEGSWS
jgi:hypothetical protein